MTDSDSDLNLKERLPSLVEVPIIGILRQSPPDRVRDVVTAATGSGLTTIEVTFDSVNSGAQIRSLVEAFPEMTVGAGTILDSTQARAAIQGVMSNRQSGIFSSDHEKPSDQLTVFAGVVAYVKHVSSNLETVIR